MRGKCLDEGTLQAYADGELAAAEAAEAALHVSACAACADALDAARAEFALFSAAFAAEEPLSVPTERLRARIDEALASRRAAQTEPRRSVWSMSALAAWLAAPFGAQPRFAGAFASVVALVTLAAVFGLVFMRDGGPRTDIARDERPSDAAAPAAASDDARRKDEVAAVTPAPVAPDVREVDEPAPNKAAKTGRGPVIVAASGTRTAAGRPASVGVSVQPNAETKAAGTVVDPTPAVPANADLAKQAVPGEENYLRTIASLSKVIEMGGDAVLRPAVRVEYERNLAVIDRAIEETRKSAVRNPKDPDATQFLFSAYRTKIDLLSTVADQAQVATLGR